MIPPAVDLPPPSHPVACIREKGGREAWDRPDFVDYIDSDDFPIRVHYDTEGYDEQAEAVLAAIELAWQVQVEEMGFAEPIIADADEGRFPVYLAGRPDVSVWEAWVSGTEWPDVDLEEGDGRNGTSSFMVLHRDLSDPWLDSYVAHEFQHATQFATDFTEPTYPIWEAVATAAQDWTLGDEGLWYTDSVESFQEVPWAPALVGDATTLLRTQSDGYYFEYGAALWVMHLDEVVGTGGGQAGVSLWADAAQEGLPNEPDVVDAFVSLTGDLATGLDGVARSRWLVGDEWDERGLADAADWGSTFVVPTAHDWTVADLPAISSFDPAPMVTGQAFVTVDLTGVEESVLAVEVASSLGLQSSLLVLWWGADGSVGEEADAGSAPRVVLETEGLARVVVAVSNLGQDGWDGDDDQYQEGDQVLSVSLEDAAPGDTGDTDGTGDTDTGAQECGCGVSPAGSAGWLPWLLVIAGTALRRRRR